MTGIHCYNIPPMVEHQPNPHSHYVIDTGRFFSEIRVKKNSLYMDGMYLLFEREEYWVIHSRDYAYKSTKVVEIHVFHGFDFEHSKQKALQFIENYEK